VYYSNVIDEWSSILLLSVIVSSELCYSWHACDIYCQSVGVLWLF